MVAEGLRRGGLVWPIVGAAVGSAITNPFGAPQVRSAGFTGALPARNNGLDIGAKAGTAVVSPSAGTVKQVLTTAGTNFGYGNSVLIQDAAGNQYRLSHLQAPPTVKVGDSVSAGQLVGRVGMTGNATGPHLDFEYKPASGGFADPLGLSFVAASPSGERGDPGGIAVGQRLPTSAAQRRQGAPAVAATPPSGQQQTTKQRLLEQLAQIDAQIAVTDPDFASALASLQTQKGRILETLAEMEAVEAQGNQPRPMNVGGVLWRYDPVSGEATALTPQQASEAGQAVDVARITQAGALEREQVSQAGALQREQLQGQTSLDVAGIQAGTTQRGQDIAAATAEADRAQRAAEAAERAAIERATLDWTRERFEIEQAFNERRLSLEQATQRATQAFQRAQAQLEADRNQIAAQANQLTQRGQDLTAATTQRGQDIETGLTQRGQDITQRGNVLQAGTSLFNQALSTAGQVGAETAQTALGALRSFAPPGTSAFIEGLRAGQQPQAPAAVPFPFDPLTIVQQAADAALARWGPQGQALIQQGAQPVAAFQAPPPVPLPPGVGPFQPGFSGIGGGGGGGGLPERWMGGGLADRVRRRGSGYGSDGGGLLPRAGGGGAGQDQAFRAPGGDVTITIRSA